MVNSGKVLERKLKRPGNQSGDGESGERGEKTGEGSMGLAFSSFSWGGGQKGKEARQTVTISWDPCSYISIMLI